MKKLFLLLAMFGMVGYLSAQSCSKSKSASNSKACCAKTAAAASKLASMDDSIEKKVCSKSGKVSYYKNEVCAVSGKVSQSEVKYDDKAKAFVNVSPTQVAAEAEGTTKKACTKAEKKACSKAKASGVSSKSCNKPCTKAKATNAEAKAKLTSVQEN